MIDQNSAISDPGNHFLCLILRFKYYTMKALKWIGGILVVLLLIGYFVGLPYLRQETKKISPERTAHYEAAGITLDVKYSSPSKKGREIFGGLVPYNEVWRTGANEPTTFTTNKEIHFAEEVLPAGTYSLWTIPGEEVWVIILNSEVPDWGVSLLSGGKKTTRDPSKDVLKVALPALKIPEVVEDLTIDFNIVRHEVYMIISWDTTEVLVKVAP
jgi:hypothetical protein